MSQLNDHMIKEMISSIDYAVESKNKKMLHKIIYTWKWPNVLNSSITREQFTMLIRIFCKLDINDCLKMFTIFSNCFTNLKESMTHDEYEKIFIQPIYYRYYGY